MEGGLRMHIDENTPVGDLLDRDPGCGEVFAAFDMPCTGCPSSHGESLAEACAIHEVEFGALLAGLRGYFGE